MSYEEHIYEWAVVSHRSSLLEGWGPAMLQPFVTAIESVEDLLSQTLDPGGEENNVIVTIISRGHNTEEDAARALHDWKWEQYRKARGWK